MSIIKIMMLEEKIKGERMLKRDRGRGRRGPIARHPKEWRHLDVSCSFFRERYSRGR